MDFAANSKFYEVSATRRNGCRNSPRGKNPYHIVPNYCQIADARAAPTARDGPPPAPRAAAAASAGDGAMSDDSEEYQVVSSEDDEKAKRPAKRGRGAAAAPTRGRAQKAPVVKVGNTICVF